MVNVRTLERTRGVGAQKHEGVWYINRAKFEHYMATSDREVPVGPATAKDGVESAVEAA